VTQARDIFFAISKDRVRGKSDDQLRRWRNPRNKAIKNFVQVVGDLPMAEITPDDMLEFRGWWNDRIDREGLTANSANKDLIHLASILRAVNQSKGLNLNMPLSGYAIKDDEPRHRPGFSEEWIRNRILAPGALDGLNKDARCILLGMINTGYRPSEAECMEAHQIRLDTEIPHISIEPNGRTLKSAYARRVIPLLGVSLEAFRACPEGFPQYRDTAGCSNAVNKFLSENGLRETPDHTLYSLRHSFQARMVKHGVDDRVRRDIFGHRLTEDRYGKIDLDVLRDALTPVAIE
jgi:integrase